MTGPYVLVGRRPELRVFDQLLQQARSGARAAVALVGEPGIGKTRLLAELCGRADDAGFDVIRGRASELEQDVLFQLVVDAMDERAAALDPAVRGRLGDERLAELAAMLPSLASSGGRLASALEAERYRCHHAVRFMLEQLARGRSLLALAWRSNQAPPMLTRAIAAAAREGGVSMLDLTPFSLGEAAQLLGDGFDSARVRALHTESGGNPFYLEQLARTPGSVAPAAPVEPSQAEQLPPVMRAAIEQELVRLSPDARLLIESGGVAGETFDLDLAAAIAGVDEAAAQAALDELLAADLVRSTGARPQARFRHPILRRAVYDAARPGWRLGAHRRAAQALAVRGAAIGAQANHVARSARVGDEQAIVLLTEAGRAAAPRAPAAAARWYEAALRLLPDGVASERRLQLLVALATALATTGRLHDSRTALWQARQALPDDMTGMRGQLTAMIARTEQGLGRGDEARRLLTEALAQTEPGSAQAAALELELAENRLMLGDWNGAAIAAAEVRAAARTLGDDPLVIAATAALGLFANYRGAVGEAEHHIDEAAAAIDALPDELLTPALLEALANLVYAEIAADRLTDASAHAERGLQVCRFTGQGFLFVRFTLGVAVTRLCQGRLADSRHASATAVEASMLLANDQFLANAEAIRCWAATLQGDLDTAISAGEAAVEAAGRAPSSLFSWFAHVCYGEALIAAGHPARGRQAILAAGGVELTDLPPTSRTFWHTVLVLAELEAGRIDAAEAITRRIEDAAASLGLESRQGDACYARACVLLARGEHDAATRSARRAVDCYEDAGMAVWAARARLVLGRALALAGDASAAEDELDTAFGALERCGAASLADRTAKELRGLGKRVARQGKRRFPRSGALAALTHREREVAERVARGYTNRQIAGELFVSEKTIEKYLAKVFAKLEVSSRAAVAAAIGRSQSDTRDASRR